MNKIVSVHPTFPPRKMLLLVVFIYYICYRILSSACLFKAQCLNKETSNHTTPAGIPFQRTSHISLYTAIILFRRDSSDICLYTAVNLFRRDSSDIRLYTAINLLRRDSSYIHLYTAISLWATGTDTYVDEG